MPNLIETAPRTRSPALNAGLALLGASVGGFVGYYGFKWLLSQGFYAVALPGVLLGVGAGLLRQRRSIPLAVLCGILALALGVFSEWRCLPFVVDQSLGYFLRHLGNLRPVAHLMILLGAFGGFYFALGKNRVGKQL